MIADSNSTLLNQDPTLAGQRRRQLRRWFGRLFGNPLSAIGLVLAAVLIVIAIAAPLFAPQDPLTMDPSNRLAPPGRSTGSVPTMAGATSSHE